MNFDIVESEYNGTRLFIDGKDVSNHVESFKLSKDGLSPLKLTVTFLDNIDASCKNFELKEVKRADAEHLICQYTAPKKKPSQTKPKGLLNRLRKRK